MRRSLLVAVLVLSWGALLCFAQRGGMRGGASFGMGGAPRGAMHMAGPVRFAGGPRAPVRFAGGPRVPVQFAGGPRAPVQFSGASHPPVRGPVHGPVHIHHGIHIVTIPPYYYYGRYGYPYSYYPYYSPFLWDWYGSSSRDSSDSETSSALMRQIDALSQEVASLREERESSQAPTVTTPVVAQVPAQTAAQKPEPDMTTVLVFLDRRIQEVRNYAIANETLTVFDDHHVRKIPLADVDLASTMKLNDERGVEFRLPDPAGTK